MPGVWQRTYPLIREHRTSEQAACDVRGIDGADERVFDKGRWARKVAIVADGDIDTARIHSPSIFRIHYLLVVHTNFLASLHGNAVKNDLDPP